MYVWDKEWIFWGNLQNRIKRDSILENCFLKMKVKSWLKSSSAVTLETKKIKSITASTFPLSIYHEVIGPYSMTLVFECWISSQPFHYPFSLSSFTLLKRLFSSSSLSAIRMLSSAYLRLLIFLLAILIPACDSSSLASPKMYSAYKVNKWCDNIQPCHTSFPILNHSIVPCPVLTVASWPTHRFLRRQVRWSGTPISLRIFTLYCDPHSQRLSIMQK